MNIILINTISIIVGIGILIGFALFMVYKLYRSKKVKKYNILKIKQYGGVNLTAIEKKFIDNNSHLYTGKMAWGMFDSRKFTLTNIKKKIKMFFLRLNPFYKYNEKIKELEKDVKYYKSDLNVYKERYYNVTHEVERLSAKLEELKNPKKKVSVPEFVKKAQNDNEKSALIPYANMKPNSMFA